jgi:hypothetical protein
MKKITIGIYHKPTQTDVTIHTTSNHPTEHKQAAYNYMIHSLILANHTSVKIRRIQQNKNNSKKQWIPASKSQITCD